MIRPALTIAQDWESYFFVADWHALTSHPEPDVLRRATREIAATWLALGLDADRSTLFRQSDVPEVQELAWILGTVIPAGLLERGHAVKAARDGGREVNASTWWYPTLMAADILAYGADVVPVGADQKQHVEMARDMAIKINVRFGDDALVVPEPRVRAEVGVVPGTDGRKMSKSYGNVVPLFDTPKRTRKAIMGIVTDSLGVDEPKDPDRCTVFQLYKLLATDDEVAEMDADLRRGRGYGYGHAKEALALVMERTVAMPRECYTEWLASPARLDEILDAGARRARVAAAATLDRLRERVGLHALRRGSLG